MRNVFVWAALLALAAGVFAYYPGHEYQPPERLEPPEWSRGALDETCIIDYVGMAYLASGGFGGSGAIDAPGIDYNSNFGIFKFTNSCTPGDTLYSYCFDLNHELLQAAYCANINPALVNPAFPEQYRAVAYLMTWYPVTGALTDDIMQLALWKLSTYSGPNGIGLPQSNTPYYRYNAGRGWPNIGDTPVYPYVNTVLGSNTTRNVAANDQARLALGAVDGLPKDVIFCDDILEPDVGIASVDGGIATVPVTVHVSRGTNAMNVGNTTAGGIKFWLTTSAGTLSASQVHTNASGDLNFTISQPYGTTIPSIIQVCTKGGWPNIIEQCSGNNLQDLVQTLSSADICTVCVTVGVQADQFLAAELRTFETIPGDGQVRIDWSTASEQNNISFKLMRSGVMVHVERADNQATGSSYSWTDREVVNGTDYRYDSISVDVQGHEELMSSANATPVASAELPAEFALEQNYPNPFNPETSISFNLAEAGHALLAVFDITGREVARLVDENLDAGHHDANFRAGNLPSGVYFYKLTTGSFSATKKMILMK